MVIQPFTPSSLPELTDLRQLIFYLMNGDLDLDHFPVPESQYVENEYAVGKTCNALYDEAYRIKQNLFNRLKSPDDPEVERLMDVLLDIAEQMSMKMFDYGWLFANLNNQSSSGQS